MENTDKIKELIEGPMHDIGLDIYEMKWLKGKDKVLQISITNKENKIDIDTCALASEKISEILDREDPIPSEYTLEVCSPGAEREIKNLSDLLEMNGGYVYIQMKEAVKSLMDVTGEIIETSENGILIEYRDKAAKRKLEINLDNIAYARFAVRI